MPAIKRERLLKSFIVGIYDMVEYWSNPELNLHEDQYRHGKTDIEIRCDGLAFSILAMLDGSNLNLPAFDVVARPHPDDKKYNKKQGLDWIKDGQIINKYAELHGTYATYRREQSKPVSEKGLDLGPEHAPNLDYSLDEELIRLMKS